MRLIRQWNFEQNNSWKIIRVATTNKMKINNYEILFTSIDFELVIWQKLSRNRQLK